MSDSTDADALPEAVEDRLYEIHFDEDPASRGRLLDALCAEYPQLADLLRARAGALTRSDDLFGRVREQLGEASASERIGPFVVRRVLGQGGFGTVYLADQLEPVQRTVALKVLQRGRVEPRALQRFESERQVLARLEHACIAKVYDAGATSEGLHYFAMELVEGQPITSWCDAAELEVEARLRLFLRVCAAIQHAHQRGVVHRDIKPSNVLVRMEDERPLPKVIDFGVAKLLAAEYESMPSGEVVPGAALPDGGLLTREGAQIGTPGYMSPEQAAGEPIDTRADVYALGVLLCELLTGQLPFARERLSGSFAAIARLLREEDPRRPSQLLVRDPDAVTAIAARRRTSPSRLLQSLRSDLDWVVLRALARRPDDRYASVAALADDVERCLRQEPVSVRERIASYWLRKFVARHRLGVAVAAGLLLTLLLGIAGLIWALSVVDESRRDAVLSGEQMAEQRDVALANSYAASMAVAQLAMASGDVGAAVRQLESADVARRGWEWRHLAAQSDHALRSVDLDREIMDLAWIDDEHCLGFESDGEIGVWSVADGARLRNLPNWSGYYRAFALDRDRGLVAIGSDDSVDLWDYREGRHLGRLFAPAGGGAGKIVRSLAWSPDRRMLVVGLRDGRLRVIQMDVQPVAVRSLPLLPSDPYSLAFVGDDELLVGLDSGTILRLDLATGIIEQTMAAHADAIDDLLADPARDLLFSASLDTTVGVRQLSTGRPRALLSGQVRVRRLALSPDGALLYGSGGWSDNRVIAWDTTTFQIVGRYHGHQQGVLGLAVSPDGSHLLTSGRELKMRLWPGMPPTSRMRLDAGHDASNLAVDARRERFAVASGDGIVSVWNATTLAPELRLETGEWWVGCALGANTVYAANNRRLAAYRIDEGVRVAEQTTGEVFVAKLTIDPQERWLVGGYGERLLVWRLPGLELLHTLELPAGTGVSIFDSRRGLFVLGGGDSTLRWLDPERGLVVDELRLADHDAFVAGLAQQGDLLVAGMHGGVLNWRHGDGALRLRRTSAIGAAISPDGSRVATAGSDQMLRLWDSATMQELMVLGDMVYGLEDVHFVAGGDRIVALSHRLNGPSYVYTWAAPAQVRLPR